MLENMWREIDYRLDVLRTTKGAHVEVYWCVVKNFSSWVTFWKKEVRIPRRFLVINVCNQGKTLCSPCTILGQWMAQSQLTSKSSTLQISLSLPQSTKIVLNMDWSKWRKNNAFYCGIPTLTGSHLDVLINARYYLSSAEFWSLCI